MSAFDDGRHSVTIANARAPDMPLIYVSEGFSRFTGYRREEVLGRNCRFLQRGEADQTGLVELRQAIAARRGCIVDLVNYRKDGSQMHNRLSLHPIGDSTGALTFYVGLQTDVMPLMLAHQRLLDHFRLRGLQPLESCMPHVQAI